MQAEHSLVVGKVAQQVLQAREAVTYVQQRLNRNLSGDDYRRANALLVQRRRELAYWLDIYDWSVKHRVPTQDALRDAGTEGMTGYEDAADDPLMRLSAAVRAAHAADRAKGPELPRRTPGASMHAPADGVPGPTTWAAMHPADNETDPNHPQN